MNSFQFVEKQQFRQKGMYFIYALLLVMIALFIYGDIQQLILGKPFGSNPAPDVVLVIITLFQPTLLILLYVTSLETVITQEGVFFRWLPYNKNYKQFSWSKINKAEIITYGFVGFGWRLTPYGTVFNVAGNKGLRLELKSGYKIILGTQKPEELAAYLKQIHVLQ